MRQAGRYLPEYRAVREKAGGFWAMARDPALVTEITIQPLARFDLDAAIIFSDILTVPHAMGQHVEFQESVGPVLGPLPDTLSFAIDRLECVYEAVSRTRKALPADKALIGFAGAPWTVACYMFCGRGGGEFMEARRVFWAEPDRAQRVIDALVDTTAKHLIAQAQAGADVLQIFESWAGLAPDLARWVIAPTKAIVARVRAACPDVPIIGFPRGLSHRHLDYAQTTGITALGLDERMDLTWAAQNLQPNLLVQGNLDPACLLAGGAALGAEVQRIKRALSGGPYIFNLGHGVDRHTPPGHVQVLIDAVRD